MQYVKELLHISIFCSRTFSLTILASKAFMKGSKVKAVIPYKFMKINKEVCETIYYPLSKLAVRCWAHFYLLKLWDQ